MDESQCVSNQSPLKDIHVVCCFQFQAITNKVAIKYSWVGFCVNISFILWDKHPDAIDGSYGSCIFSFIGTCKLSSSLGAPFLYSHQQCMKDSASPHPHQLFPFSVSHGDLLSPKGSTTCTWIRHFYYLKLLFLLISSLCSSVSLR